ncbi:MAG: hypothetical protein RLY86_2411 [Pseudomonadota bacterium]|jgi:endogenous inhibitor of DNA gyrase (YacG/DUF329 family)
MPTDPIAFPKPRKAPACPVCGRPTVAEYRPFCSKRCADVDLSRWLSGVYRVPAAEEDEPETDSVEKFMDR